MWCLSVDRDEIPYNVAFTRTNKTGTLMNSLDPGGISSGSAPFAKV